MDLYILDVPTVAEIGEVALHQGVSNWKATVIWLEVALGHIRLMFGSVRQDMIPGTVLGWPRTGYGFVPVLGSLKMRVDIDDYASVIEQSVLHHVTDSKMGTRHPDHRFIIDTHSAGQDRGHAPADHSNLGKTSLF